MAKKLPPRPSGLLGTVGKRAFQTLATLSVIFLSFSFRSCRDFFSSKHIEQLLRTLNLNSPAPYNQQPSLSLSFDLSPSSPDFSPMSTSSTLLTPTDLSPARSFDLKLSSNFEFGPSANHLSQSSLLEPSSPTRPLEFLPLSDSPPFQRQSYSHSSHRSAAPNPFPFFEPFSERPSPAPTNQPFYGSPQPLRRPDSNRAMQPWRQQQQQLPTPSEWLRTAEEPALESRSGLVGAESSLRPSLNFQYPSQGQGQNVSHAHEASTLRIFSLLRCLLTTAYQPINFLTLLHPSSSPPYHVFVARIIKSSDQQASIFLQQKLKVADVDERAKIVDAICARGFEMMAHR